MDKNQLRVLEMMKVFEQECPSKPSLANEETRLLRAKLILEETLEFINALGLKLEYIDNKNFNLTKIKEPNLLEIVDAISDIEVINKGAAVAFGLDSEKFFNLVMYNNLTKLVNGKPLKNQDGKVIKPENYIPVTEDLRKLLNNEINSYLNKMPSKS